MLALEIKKPLTISRGNKMELTNKQLEPIINSIVEQLNGLSIDSSNTVLRETRIRILESHSLDVDKVKQHNKNLTEKEILNQKLRDDEHRS
jgi:hypothetical protein